MRKILIVDDEPDVVEILKYMLEREGYQIIVGYDGEDALEKALEKPDLILLDIVMTDMDGFEVSQRIKLMEGCRNIPIIFLTAKSSDFDEVKALELGATDYIRKPISTIKILARIRAALRNTEKDSPNGSGTNGKVTPPLVIDKESYTVTINGENVFFPKKEFLLLQYLVDNTDKVITREDLLKKIWGENYNNTTRTVDVHIRKIRMKLGEENDLIETIKGVGYKFKQPLH